MKFLPKMTIQKLVNIGRISFLLTALVVPGYALAAESSSYLLYDVIPRQVTAPGVSTSYQLQQGDVAWTSLPLTGPNFSITTSYTPPPPSSSSVSSAVSSTRSAASSASPVPSTGGGRGRAAPSVVPSVPAHPAAGSSSSQVSRSSRSSVSLPIPTIDTVVERKSRSSASAAHIRSLVPTFKFRRALPLTPEELRLRRILFPRTWLDSLLGTGSGSEGTTFSEKQEAGTNDIFTLILMLHAFELILIWILYRRVRSLRLRKKRQSSSRKQKP